MIVHIRAYTESDLDRVVELHRRGKHDFELPDLGDAHVVVKKCLVDEDGKVRLAAFGRVQVNAYLLVDGAWKDPQQRLEAIEILEFAMVEQARIAGFDQVTAQVDPRFGRRLQMLGWQRSIGVTYHREF